jgi:hypothetical protein
MGILARVKRPVPVRAKDGLAAYHIVLKRFLGLLKFMLRCIT